VIDRAAWGPLMSRMEVAAWVQVAVGVLALVITAMTATPALNALIQVSMGEGVPGSFRSAQGAIQLFVVVLVIATSLVFVSIGVAVIIGRLFALLGASAPYYAAFCVVIAMLLISAAGTLALLKLRVWLWPLLQATLCLILAGQAQVDSPKKEAFWSFMIIGTALCFLVALLNGALR
jgi:hypothetical protein